MTDIYTSAAALYDGGWRSSDRDEMIAEYDLSADEADELCKALAKLEAKNSAVWYAVQSAFDDTDWDNGTYDREEAIAAVREMYADGNVDARIAVIQEGDNPICIEEIYARDIVE